MSGVGMPLRMVMASFGPMPLTVISFSNNCFSSARRKPNSESLVFADVCMDKQRDLLAALGQVAKGRDGDDDVVADPAHSTMAWFGCLEIRCPRMWAIIRPHCRR